MNRNLKSIAIVLLLANFCNTTFAQRKNDPPYKFSEPQFIGGQDGFVKYLLDKLQLDKNSDLKKGGEGNCDFVFILNKDSSIAKFSKTDSSSNSQFNELIESAIKNSTSLWMPAKVNEKPVDLTMSVTISFDKKYFNKEPSKKWANYNFVADKLLENNYYNEGVLVQSDSNYKEAIFFYNEALDFKTYDDEAMFNRGICYLKITDTLSACKEWYNLNNTASDIADKALSKYCKVFLNLSDSEIFSNNSLYTIVEQMPEFPGGEDMLLKYVGSNTVYPAIERRHGIQGTVYLTFIITKDGSLKNIKVMRGVHGGPGFDTESIRVLSTMPKWKPGMQGGKVVNVQFQLPIRFTLK